MGSWKRSTVGTPGNRATSSLVEEEKPVKGNIEVVLLGEEGRPEEQGRGAGGGGVTGTKTGEHSRKWMWPAH